MTQSLEATLKLLRGTIASKPDMTCRQLLLVLLCLEHGEISNKELAEMLDMSEGAVSRAIDTLGPEGTGCLEKDGRVITVSQPVKTALTMLLS